VEAAVADVVGAYVFFAVIVVALVAFVIWLVSGLSKSRGSRRR
jgi:hypothetical protein